MKGIKDLNGKGKTLKVKEDNVKDNLFDPRVKEKRLNTSER